ncbi:MAG: RsmD family RNA methyltransferase [Coriobacteriales bacterium]|jgi:16S rRNA (guanine966-N2)-methyltransferase|nr:RsmD family RNA methyltransferase [Coriobacteriales bacterium]
MRVIAGRFKGHPLAAVPGQNTRPTTDRVREAWASSINILRPGGFADATVLDAFAGSAALGLEAWSRGASSLLLIDNDPRAIQTIRKNLVALGLTSNPAIKLIKGDSLSPMILRHLALVAPFDLVFIDPPYNTPKKRIISFVRFLADSNLLAEGCLISYEHQAIKPKHVDKPAVLSTDSDNWPPSLKMVSGKQYSNTAIEYFRYDTDDEGSGLSTSSV